MDELLNTLGDSRRLGIGPVFLSLMMAFILSQVIAAIYRWTYQGFSYTRGFLQAMTLGSMITCFLIMAIGNNLAMGLGILGTLAIIRFRTQVRDPRDMIFLFACLGLGISCGAGGYSVAVIGTICFSLAVLYLHWAPSSSTRQYEGLVRFFLPLHSDAGDTIEDTFQRFCASSKLTALREAVQGESNEYSYHVRLIDPSYQEDLLEHLRAIEDVREPSVLMHRATVEI